MKTANNHCDSNGNVMYFQDSYGYWIKYVYDSNGNEICFEDSDGESTDNRK